MVKLHSSDGNERDRLKRSIMSNPESFDVCITTYEMVKSPNLSHALARMCWRYIVLDEGHVIKVRR